MKPLYKKMAKEILRDNIENEITENLKSLPNWLLKLLKDKMK